MQIAAPLHSELKPALQWIEVASFFQIPSFHIIGLPAPEIAEARERVRAAIDAVGLEFPRRRIIVNLAPAGVRKRGTGVDLAVALGILLEGQGAESVRPGERWVAWGELGLNGALKASGQLTRGICAAWGAADVFLVSRDEASAAREILSWLAHSGWGADRGAAPRLEVAATLGEAWERVLAKAQAPWASVTAIAETLTGQPNDSVSEATSLQGAGLLPLRGSLKRTIAIAATGRHHLLLLGPRGVGKTHASEWLLALQPRAEARTSLERAWLAELSSEQTVLPSESSAPVRRIGSQARPPALLGHCSIASDTIRPGEFSLAHGGVLVADEIPEWHRDTRELLREPLESGRVTLNRARGVAELPARFQLVATGNLCPCGGWPSTLTRTAGGDDSGEHAPSCRCSPNRQGQYLERLSGPVLDRTDIVSIVGKSAPLRALGTGAASPARQSDGLERLDFRVREYAELREQVEHARTRCLSRYSKLPSALSSQELEELLSEHPSWKKALGRVLVRGLRSRHKALRVALTLAAWDDAPEPLSAHFVEASFFRPERLGIFG